MNSKDLCAIEYLQDLREAGVTGFKVEGRTKSVYYLAHIGRAYRKAIDDLLNGKPFDAEVLTDVYATASRGFMPGFLTPMAEETRQNYDSGEPVYATYKFGGVVRGYNRGKSLVEIEVKNRLFVGDCVEFVSPNEVFEQQIRAMYDLDDNPITVAHGGGEQVWLSIDRKVEPFTVLRIQNI